MHAHPPSEADGAEDAHPVHGEAEVGTVRSITSRVRGATVTV